jgi:hypothetical protein
MGFQFIGAGCRASLKQPTETKRDGVVFEHRVGVLTCDRKGGVCRTPSPREHTRAWRAGTHLQQTLIETSCAIGISGGVKAAPLGIRHGQGRLKIKLAAGQPFNNEHRTGANRTSPMSWCVRLVGAVRAEQIAAIPGLSPAIPAKGRHLRMTELNLWRIENGRVSEQWDIYDNWGAWMQLGFIDPDRICSAQAVK